MGEVALTINHEAAVQLRRLLPSDIDRIKELCSQWFPIQYPEHWFEDITSSPRFFSFGAVIDGQLDGLIVSEIKPQSRCNREDQDIVACGLGPDPFVAYILSLGVVAGKRRKGIGTILLQHLIWYLKSDDAGCQCKAIFLHVLSTNSDAIRFYESQQFIRHHFLPLYYFIDGKCLDGISYVTYMNGGRAPVTFSAIRSFVVEICTSCLTSSLYAFSCFSRFVACKVSRFVRMPSRVIYLTDRFRSQSPTVKYHQVASA